MQIANKIKGCVKYALFILVLYQSLKLWYHDNISLPEHTWVR